MRILELAFAAGKNGSHVGSGLSSVEILCALYGEILNLNIKNPTDKARDRFILSKGHSAIALFAVLEYIGLLSKHALDKFESNGSHYYAHAKRDINKGIEFSGGSLSLGLSYAVGIALSLRKDKLNNRVFVLVGDGECDEGLIWEALASASHFKLDNLCVIVDYNGIQSDGFTSDVMNKSTLSGKFQSFGFDVKEVDGHNIEQLVESLKTNHVSRPKAIIANTTKGKGVSFMERNVVWHHNVLSEDQYKLAVNEQIMNE